MDSKWQALVHSLGMGPRLSLLIFHTYSALASYPQLPQASLYNSAQESFVLFCFPATNIFSHCLFSVP